MREEVMHEGTIDHAPAHPREMMRRAPEVGAGAVILVHNHPSGDPSPSGVDVEMTRQMVEAGKAVRISMHDHLIVGRDGARAVLASPSSRCFRGDEQD
jgi:DNA repair protein RadC